MNRCMLNFFRTVQSPVVHALLKSGKIQKSAGKVGIPAEKMPYLK